MRAEATHGERSSALAQLCLPASELRTHRGHGWRFRLESSTPTSTLIGKRRPPLSALNNQWCETESPRPMQGEAHYRGFLGIEPALVTVPTEFTEYTQMLKACVL